MSKVNCPPKLIVKKSDVLKEMKPSQVAKTLGITKQAVNGWGDIIPELRALRLLEVNPALPHSHA